MIYYKPWVVLYYKPWLVLENDYLEWISIAKQAFVGYRPQL